MTRLLGFVFLLAGFGLCAYGYREDVNRPSNLAKAIADTERIVNMSPHIPKNETMKRLDEIARSAPGFVEKVSIIESIVCYVIGGTLFIVGAVMAFRKLRVPAAPPIATERRR